MTGDQQNKGVTEQDEEAATLTARADVALVAVEETVPDPHVRPRGGVAQLPLADPALRRRRDKQGSDWGGFTRYKLAAL